MYTTDIVAEQVGFGESKAANERNTDSETGGFDNEGDDGFMNIPDGIDEELPFN